MPIPARGGRTVTTGMAVPSITIGWRLAVPSDPTDHRRQSCPDSRIEADSVESRPIRRLYSGDSRDRSWASIPSGRRYWHHVLLEKNTRIVMTARRWGGSGAAAILLLSLWNGIGMGGTPGTPPIRADASPRGATL